MFILEAHQHLFLSIFNPTIRGRIPSNELSRDKIQEMVRMGVRVEIIWQAVGSSRENIINASPLDKMATILADDIFKCIFLNENDKIPIPISLKFVSRSPALLQAMACYRTLNNADAFHWHVYAALWGRWVDGCVSSRWKYVLMLYYTL